MKDKEKLFKIAELVKDLAIVPDGKGGHKAEPGTTPKRCYTAIMKIQVVLLSELEQIDHAERTDRRSWTDNFRNVFHEALQSYYFQDK